MSADNAEETQSRPEPPEPTFPNPPEVKTVETEGSSPGNPNRVRITVEYFSHRGGMEELETTVHYWVRGTTAKYHHTEGEGKLTDQLSAILVANDTVPEVPGIEEVKTIEAIRDDAAEYIEKCRKNAEN